MIFVIEGPDLCGKSTAASDVGVKLNIPVIRPWAELSSAKESLTSISRTLLSVAGSVRTDFLFDRFITSEYVYGQICGRDVEYLDALLAEWIGFDLVVMQGVLSKSELIRRYRTRSDALFSLTDLHRIRRAYANLPALLPRWIEHSVWHDVDELMTQISARRPRQQLPHQ